LTIQDKSVNRVPQTLPPYPHSTHRNFYIRDLDGAARLLENAVATIRFDAPGSHQDTVYYEYKPNADEPVVASAGPDPKAFALAEDS
jgi:hypothetical protein